MKLGCAGRADVAVVRAWLLSVWSIFAVLDARPASAQECPFGYPVDCGTYCCESGGVCYNGGCNAPQEPDPTPGAGSCPSGYPVDCGTYCCESGGVCYNGGCNAPQGPDPDPGGGSCPSGYPVDCGTYCCESGGVCYDGGCNAPQGPNPDPGGSTCPDGYPVDCGTFCCPSGGSCGSNETCLASSQTGPDVVVEECPASYPIDCGNDYCCPSGTSCTVNGCMSAGGSPIEGSDVVCASQAVNTDFGACNLDFCIANAASGSCESYYLVNGSRISCSGCAADASCVQLAAEACTGQGISNEPTIGPASPSGDCCTASDACDWANDGVCDCGGTYSDSWDADDCAPEDSAACTVRNVSAARGGYGLAFAALGLSLLLRRRR
jgi:hypothetical protein